MKLSITRIRKNIPFALTIGLTLTVVLFSINYQPPPDSNLTQAQLAIIDNFKEHCRCNELIIDSIKNAVNKKFNYPIDIYVDPIEEDGIYELYRSVPYYGMSDGVNAFIFSLHKREIHKVNIYYNGDGKYTISGEGLFYPLKAWVRVPKNENYTTFLDALIYYIKKNGNQSARPNVIKDYTNLFF